MATVINTNIAALGATINLQNTHDLLSININRLSTGLRVNAASDDPGSFGIIKGLEMVIATNKQAKQNTLDAQGVISIADGALSAIGKMLERMKVLAKQASNSTYSTSSRSSMNVEFTNLRSEIDRIGLGTEFNGKRLLTGGFASATTIFYIHAGVRNDAGIDVITTNIATVSVVGLSGGGGGISAGGIINRQSASTLLDSIDSAITQVSRWRGNFGAVINRLSWTNQNNDIQLQNVTASMSRMRDVDFASEVSDMTRNQILVQSGTAMLTQANQLPNSVVQLLG